MTHALCRGVFRRQRAAGVRTRTERGVAAVETGLITVLLSPMLAGVLWFGQHFWMQQRMPEPQVSQSAVVGVFTTCQDLLAAVKGSVLVNADNAARATGVLPVEAADITAEVVDFLPDRVGVDVRVSIRVPIGQTVMSWLVPDDGYAVSEAMTRLENVRLTVASC